MRLPATIVTFLALLPAAPAAAQVAVSLRFHPSDGAGDPAGYDARIQSDRTGGGRLIIATERGAFTVSAPDNHLLAGDGCSQLVSGAVRCVADQAPDLLFAVGATLSDTDDDVTVTGPLAVSLDGRAGNDRLVAGDGVPQATLVGGPGDDLLAGTPGDDRLDGGPGHDVVLAGAGADEVTEGDDQPASADVLDGGPGRDRLSYVGRRAGVTIDLTRPAAGAPGEADQATGFENASGGDGPDVLLGDAGANVLAGGLGADRLDGRAGDDALDAGAPRVLPGSEGDRVAGGAGDDRIAAWPGDVVAAGAGADEVLRQADALGPPARIDCGAGGDTLVDPVERSAACETLRLDGRGSARAVRRGSAAVTLTWLDDAGGGRPCGVVARLVTASGRALGPAIQVRADGRLAHVRVPLPRAASRATAVRLWRATSCRPARWPVAAFADVPV